MKPPKRIYCHAKATNGDRDWYCCHGSLTTARKFSTRSYAPDDDIYEYMRVEKVPPARKRKAAKSR